MTGSSDDWLQALVRRGRDEALARLSKRGPPRLVRRRGERWYYVDTGDEFVPSESPRR